MLLLQNITDEVHFFQIPFSQRGYGIRPETFVISGYEDNIYDDGDGNLLQGEEQVGNIWYNSGVVLIYIEDFSEEDVSITFLREVQFVRHSYYVHMRKEDTTFSTNPTFINSNAPNPFITNISLLNEDNQPIMKARLSRPLDCKQDILFLLEQYES